MDSEKPSAQEGAKNEKHGNRSSRGVKIFIGCVAGIAAVAAIAVGGFIAYMRIAYADFYAQAKAEFETPSLASGFIPQDLAYSKSADAWFFSGYETDDSPSPIWRMNADNTLTQIKVIEPNGNVYHGHGGGFTFSDDFAFLTCEDGYMAFPIGEFLKEGSEIEAKASGKVEVGFDPAFINVQDNALYTGVFYYEGPYDTPEKMHLTSPSGTQNHAVMYAYSLDPHGRFGVSDAPFAVYSIPDKVQGVALTESGQMMFSTSWGLGASVLPIYDLEGLAPSGKYDVDGKDVDLYFMDSQNLVKEIKAPPMMEGIIFHDDRIWLSNESASNKYIFGKLYGGGQVYSIAAS